MMPKRPVAVIILAAGGGTRMRSGTPKVLHPLGGRTLLGHALVPGAPSSAGWPSCRPISTVRWS
jgi:2-C-methyl-D-erythritol 4-phosphate cytidylyltransferase